MHPTYICSPHKLFQRIGNREIIRYGTQNTSPEDFIRVTALFLQRLIQHGHLLKDLIPIFKSIAASLESVRGDRKFNQETSLQDDTLYIHRTFHPRDIRKHEIR